jgi:hypothetical protein
MSAGERDEQAAVPQQHWLSRPGTIRVLWVVFAVILAATLAAEALVHMHPRFRFEDWFGFHAGYGFLACVGMVLFAKALGAFLKRPDDYYQPTSARSDGEERGRD